MTSIPQKKESIQKIVLVSFRFSNIGIFSWDRPIPMLKEVLKKHGLKTYLYIKVFGKDELWAITSLVENSKFETLKREPLVAYVASLEKSLPLDLMAIDKIVEGQFPVGYLFFKKKNKAISLRRIENLIKKKGIPFLVGEINHPEGFSQFAAFAVENKALRDLARLAHELMGGLKCEKWECFLGVEHVWEGYGEDLKDKMKTAKDLLKLINRWSHGIP